MHDVLRTACITLLTPFPDFGSLQVLTTALTLALLAGGAFLWFKASSSNEDGGDGGDGSGSDGDDALSEARRIMDKYK